MVPRWLHLDILSTVRPSLSKAHSAAVELGNGGEVCRRGAKFALRSVRPTFLFKIEGSKCHFSTRSGHMHRSEHGHVGDEGKNCDVRSSTMLERWSESSFPCHQTTIHGIGQGSDSFRDCACSVPCRADRALSRTAAHRTVPGCWALHICHCIYAVFD